MSATARKLFWPLQRAWQEKVWVCDWMTSYTNVGFTCGFNGIILLILLYFLKDEDYFLCGLTVSQGNVSLMGKCLVSLVHFQKRCWKRGFILLLVWSYIWENTVVFLVVGEHTFQLKTKNIQLWFLLSGFRQGFRWNLVTFYTAQYSKS